VPLFQSVAWHDAALKAADAMRWECSYSIHTTTDSAYIGSRLPNQKGVALRMNGAFGEPEVDAFAVAGAVYTQSGLTIYSMGGIAETCDSESGLRVEDIKTLHCARVRNTRSLQTS
jgi:hypothetical protein